MCGKIILRISKIKIKTRNWSLKIFTLEQEHIMSNSISYEDAVLHFKGSVVFSLHQKCGIFNLNLILNCINYD